MNPLKLYYDKNTEIYLDLSAVIYFFKLGLETRNI